jgi:hypothetical protein
MPTAKECFMLGDRVASFGPAPIRTRTANPSPATSTVPRRCCQVIPMVARPKARKAFSPMYGAAAIGRFAQRAISAEPTTAVRMVATVPGPDGMPANARIAGLTTMM